MHVRNEGVRRNAVHETAEGRPSVGAKGCIHIRYGPAAQQKHREPHEPAQGAAEPRVGPPPSHTVHDIDLGVVEGGCNAHDVVSVELPVAVDMHDDARPTAEAFFVCGERRGAMPLVTWGSNDVGERRSSAARAIRGGVVDDDDGNGDADAVEGCTDLREERRQRLGLVEGRYHDRNMVLHLHPGIPALGRDCFTRRFPRTCSV